MAKSNYLEEAITAWIKGTTFPAAPTSVFVGLFSSSPTDTGVAGTEVTTSVRPAGRVAVSFGAAAQVGGAAQIANNVAVDFGDSAAVATISHFALFSLVSGGNMLYHAALNTARSVQIGDSLLFPVGDLSVSES